MDWIAEKTPRTEGIAAAVSSTHASRAQGCHTGAHVHLAALLDHTHMHTRRAPHRRMRPPRHLVHTNVCMRAAGMQHEATCCALSCYAARPCAGTALQAYLGW